MDNLVIVKAKDNSSLKNFSLLSLSVGVGSLSDVY